MTTANAASGETGNAESQKSDILGRRSGRVLALVADLPASETISRLRSLLETSDHAVALAPFDQIEAALSSVRPDLILLDASETTPAVEALRVLRREDGRVSALVVLPAGDVETTDLWLALRDAGADDFVVADVSRDTFEARAEILFRLTRAARDLEAVRERLARHMQIDETTGLLNRRYFFQSSHRECSRARRYGHPLACLMVDVDYLDEINKKFGYACVEYVLRAVAYTVRQWTRDSDICGRFSDRKFVVLLPETDVEGATAVREKILNALSGANFNWEGEELPVTVSFGEAERRTEAALSEPQPVEDPENDEFGTEPLSVREELASLLEEADAALNVARRSSLRPDIFTPYTPGLGDGS